MPILGLFLLELALLFLLSKEVTKILSRILFSLFHNYHVVIHVLAFLFLPGVIIHELSHFFMASILFVPTGEIEFMPEIRGSEVKMGSVAIASTADPLRRFLIGVAPFLLGIGCLLLIFWYLLPVRAFVSWQTFLLLYSAFEISNTMFSSKKDMEGTLGLLVVIVLVLIGCYFLGVPLGTFLLTLVSNPKTTSFLKDASLYFGLIVFVDFVFVVLCQSIIRFIDKK